MLLLTFGKHPKLAPFSSEKNAKNTKYKEYKIQRKYKSQSEKKLICSRLSTVIELSKIYINVSINMKYLNKITVN